MRLALIPPIEMLSETKHTDYQLLLPHLLRDETYATHYLNLLQDKNQYVIMDNGAAEGEEFTGDQLSIIAQQYHVDEVVAPDVLGNADETYRLTVEFIKHIKDLPADEWDYQRRIGVVAQGKNVDEAYKMVVKLLGNPNTESWIDVVYLPRLLVTQTDKWARIKLAERLYKRINVDNQDYPDVQFHFLGASKYWPMEILSAAQTVPFVRGMDTSMPYNYGFAYTRVTGEAQIDRDQYYFESVPDPTQQEYMEVNRQQMLAWAEGKDG